MKYDCEIPVHDFLGRQTATKGDAMRKVIQHIDERNWRTLEYFRMLDKQNKLQLDSKKVTSDFIGRYFIEKSCLLHLFNRNLV